MPGQLWIQKRRAFLKGQTNFIYIFLPASRQLVWFIWFYTSAIGSPDEWCPSRFGTLGHWDRPWELKSEQSVFINWALLLESSWIHLRMFDRFLFLRILFLTFRGRCTNQWKTWRQVTFTAVKCSVVGLHFNQNFAKIWFQCSVKSSYLRHAIWSLCMWLLH